MLFALQCSKATNATAVITGNTERPLIFGASKKPWLEKTMYRFSLSWRNCITWHAYVKITGRELLGCWLLGCHSGRLHKLSMFMQPPYPGFGGAITALAERPTEKVPNQTHLGYSGSPRWEAWSTANNSPAADSGISWRVGQDNSARNSTFHQLDASRDPGCMWCKGWPHEILTIVCMNTCKNDILH